MYQLQLPAALLVGLFVGAAIVWWLRPDHSARVTNAETKLATAEGDCHRLQEANAKLEGERSRLTAEVREVGERAAGAETQVSSLKDQLSAFRTEAERQQSSRNGDRDQLTALTGELRQTQERERELRRRLEEDEKRRTDQQMQFENLANRVLENATGKLTEASHERLDPMLQPLRERLGDFQKKVQEIYDAESRERVKLGAEIEATLRTSLHVGAQADALARALKGESQMRGQMGETMLERVLQAADLQRGLHYVLQGEGLGLRDENDRAQKPDVIVHLEDGKCIIIDSKVALNDYATWAAAESDDARATALAAFVSAVRGHVSNLAGKRYQNNEKLHAPEFVLLYMPIEAALAIAIQADPDLFQTAWKRHVAIVGPNTLVVTMRVVQRMWAYEIKRQNANEIADEAVKLFEQLAAATESLNTAGTAIGRAKDAHTDAMKRMFTGRGNITRRAERLKQLGLNSKKALPTVIVGIGDAEESADDVETVDAPSPLASVPPALAAQDGQGQ